MLKPSDLAKWKVQYRELSAYFMLYGHCRVPSRDKQHPALSRWVQKQRMNKSRLTANQISHLDKLSFTWSEDILKEERKEFLLMLSKLRTYFKKHGHSNVPGKDPENYTLSRWVEWQRIQEKKGKLPEWKKQKLIVLDFEFSEKLQTEKRLLWYRMLDKLLDFKKEYGHCNVPESYFKLSEDGSKDFSLWVWVSYQRHPKKPLTPAKTALLKELGFDFHPAPNYQKARSGKGRFVSSLAVNPLQE